jgi:flagellar biosynthesis/type III secretory pathway protein FliH
LDIAPGVLKGVFRLNGLNFGGWMMTNKEQTVAELAAAHWQYVGELSSIIGGFHYQSAFVHGHKHGYQTGYQTGYQAGYQDGVKAGQASCSCMER